jgi:hypothetical protein
MPEQHDDANQQAAARTSKKAAKNAAAIALKNRRTEQMNAAAQATRRLREALRQVKKIISQRHALESHLDGFYSEVDKLAKGRAMLEVTPFVLEQTNEIIKDAKTIVTQDVHLDRIKEFVAAGNIPCTPMCWLVHKDGMIGAVVEKDAKTLSIEVILVGHFHGKIGAKGAGTEIRANRRLAVIRVITRFGIVTAPCPT